MDFIETNFENVNCGISLLNTRRALWLPKIRIDNIKMWSGLDCILGQVFGCYNDGVDRLIQYTNYTDRQMFAYDHGFNLHPAHPDYYETSGVSWDFLASLWVGRILDLRIAEVGMSA